MMYYTMTRRKGVQQGPACSGHQAQRFKDNDGNFIKLHAVKRYWKVHQLDNPDYFFDLVAMDQEI